MLGGYKKINLLIKINNFLLNNYRAGFLALPFAFYHGGIVIASIVIALIAYMTYYSDILYLKVYQDLDK